MSKQGNLNVHSKLIEYLFNIKKFDTSFFIAKILLEKINEFPDITIEQIAFLANTTPSTVSKFCKRLGYDGFTSLKNDKGSYGTSNLINNFYLTSIDNKVEESLDFFLKQINLLFKDVFNKFDKQQMHRIALKLINTKKVVLLSSIHSYIPANIFSELILPYDIYVYQLERSSDISMIESLIKESELIFIVSLTGKWIEETFTQLQISKEKLDEIIIITYEEKISDCANEVVLLSKINQFFSSSFISSSAILSFFVILSAYLGELTSNQSIE